MYYILQIIFFVLPFFVGRQKNRTTHNTIHKLIGQNTRNYHSLSINCAFFSEYFSLIYHSCDCYLNHCRHCRHYIQFYLLLRLCSTNHVRTRRCVYFYTNRIIASSRVATTDTSPILFPPPTVDPAAQTPVLVVKLRGPPSL